MGRIDNRYKRDMKQTAVEWLANSIINLEERLRLKKINLNDFIEKKDLLVEQAKAMEKEQLCYFYVKGAEAEINNPYVTNIEFYNKTFKSE